MKTHHLSAIAFIGLFILLGVVGVLVLSNDQPPTGMVIAEPRGIDFYGAYRIKPEITSKVSFDMGIYQKISSYLPALASCTDRGTSLEDCLSAAQAATGLEWELDCMKGKERIFYDIAEFYDDCISSPDSECLCSRKFGDANYIQKNKLEGSYEFSITPDQQGIALSDKGETLTRSVALTDVAIDSLPLSLSFMYGGAEATLQKKVNGGVVTGTLRTNPTPELLYYKKKEGQVTKLLLVSDDDGRLRTPPLGNPIYNGNKEVTRKTAWECQKKSKKIQRFCVSDPSKKYLIYDGIDGDVKERPITVRFAAVLSDSPPPPLTDVKMFDFPKADRSIILSWTESAALDTQIYHIYRALSSDLLSLTPTNTPASNGEVSTISLRAGDAEDLNAQLDPALCTFDYAGKNCLFTAGAKTILLKRPRDGEQGALYKIRGTDGVAVYLYTMPIKEDGKENAFAVTAVDRNGNEIDNVEQKMPVVSGSSIDDLPPGSEGIVHLPQNPASAYDSSTKTLVLDLADTSFPQSAKNIDGTPAPDAGPVVAYYLKNPSTKPADTALLSSFEGKITGSVANGKLSVSFADKNPQPNDEYALVIVAEDSSGNPKQGAFSPREIGATVLSLVIP